MSKPRMAYFEKDDVLHLAILSNKYGTIHTFGFHAALNPLFRNYAKVLDKGIICLVPFLFAIYTVYRFT